MAKTAKYVRNLVALGAVTCALVMSGAGAASAYTPGFGAIDSPLLGSSDSPLLGSSVGIHLSNNTDNTFVLTAVSGDNEGVPAVGSELPANSPNSYLDFEVVWRAAKKTTVTADFDVYGLDGTMQTVKYGTTRVTLSVDAIRDVSAHATFTDIGNWPLQLCTALANEDDPWFYNTCT
ncbi:hypothetical protein [Rhodococcus sp. (in: high G+C Gram-positive bacteria)]|uniref:hypothetical protein n=1 Tax=Rhodococcus sp. TaxID=1831 RepID=UPI00257D596B|nr:hypothetical protein [Rhodococcus sp. (in: high G+C Gram-positive bacteria)]MBQ7803958.1 hypothetical protein [Rhodococcus sp. (in: high G+C Gram-positive bacteria)]